MKIDICSEILKFICYILIVILHYNEILFCANFLLRDYQLATAAPCLILPLKASCEYKNMYTSQFKLYF